MTEDKTAPYTHMQHFWETELFSAPTAEDICARRRHRTPTALSYWFPKLEAAGLPVPKTIIVPMNDAAILNIYEEFNRQNGGRDDSRFYDVLEAAAHKVGVPCFLRTDYNSAKMRWKYACFLEDITKLRDHVMEVAYMSEMASHPWGVWCVREFLPTIPHAVLPDFDDMPLTREFRCFVRDGNLLCVHPYWWPESLEQGAAPPDTDYDALCHMTELERWEIEGLARAAGKAVGGDWSVDILETKLGWYITDMAEAGGSAHWEGCPNQQLFRAS